MCEHTTAVVYGSRFIAGVDLQTYCPAICPLKPWGPTWTCTEVRAKQMGLWAMDDLNLPGLLQL